MNYAKINLFDIANGQGIRVSLFVSGCRFHCPDCFNEASWNFNYGTKFTEQTEQLILDRLKDSNFAGLTLIGGDPLWQTPEDMECLIRLCNKVHELGKNIWIWSGFTWGEIFNDFSLEGLTRQKLIKACDVFVDGRFVKEQKDLSLAWRGSSNQNVINITETLKYNTLVKFIR